MRSSSPPPTRRSTRRRARRRSRSPSTPTRRARSRRRPPGSRYPSCTSPPTMSSTGRRTRAYVEDDAVGPINAYGRTKLAGEVAVRDANPLHLILRTSWVYAAEGTNFVRSMLRLAETRDEVRIVADQQGCPTAAADIAAAIAARPPRPHGGCREGRHVSRRRRRLRRPGTALPRRSSRASRRAGMRRPRNIPITTADYPTPARRPLNSRLDSDGLRRRPSACGSPGSRRRCRRSSTRRSGRRRRQERGAANEGDRARRRLGHAALPDDAARSTSSCCRSTTSRWSITRSRC